MHDATLPLPTAAPGQMPMRRALSMPALHRRALGKASRRWAHRSASALALVLVLWCRSASPCTPPPLWLELCHRSSVGERAPLRVPAQGVIVLRGHHGGDPYRPPDVRVVDEQGSGVAGKASFELHNALVWRANRPLDQGATYQLHLPCGEPVSLIASAPEPAPVGFTGTLDAIEVREERDPLDLLCCRTSFGSCSVQSCWTRSAAFASRYVFKTNAAVTPSLASLDFAYLRARLIAVDEGGTALSEADATPWPRRKGQDLGDDGHAIMEATFAHQRERYCVQLELWTLLGETRWLSEARCIEHSAVLPGSNPMVEHPRLDQCDPSSVTINGSPVAMAPEVWPTPASQRDDPPAVDAVSRSPVSESGGCSLVADAGSGSWLALGMLLGLSVVSAARRRSPGGLGRLRPRL